MEDRPLHATVCLGLAEWCEVAAALVALAGRAGIRSSLAAEIRAAIAAQENDRYAVASLALRPADAAVVRALRAGVRRREADCTVADVAAFLGRHRLPEH